MGKAFHHKKTGVTFPIGLDKRSVHNFSHSVNMAATLNITFWKCYWNGTRVKNNKTSIALLLPNPSCVSGKTESQWTNENYE